MLIATHSAYELHAVTVNPPTAENPRGYHRLIGGSVELGETHRAAIEREVAEELAATITRLEYVAAVENIFTIDGERGHEVVFLYRGQLEPQPPLTDAVLTESDGSIVPVRWRPIDDADEPLPLYPAQAAEWMRRLLNPAHASRVELPPEAV